MLLKVSIFFVISDSADLHFVRSADGLTGRNLVKNDLCFMWCGAQSNFGVKSGKICYECKVSNVQVSKMARAILGS